MAEDSYSIDELARAAGMTTRNVRAYRTKGLLPPPVRAGRASEYRTAHLRRLRDIRELRDAGLPLKMIIVAASSGEELGPAGRLRRLAAQIDPADAIDVRDEPVPTSTRPTLVDVPPQGAAVRRLREIGLAPVMARSISGRITQHGALLAAYLGETVTAQAPELGIEARRGVADLTVHLTGIAVRQALGVTD